MTTVTKDYERVSMHGVRRKLLRPQAEATWSLPSAVDHEEEDE